MQIFTRYHLIIVGVNACAIGILFRKFFSVPTIANVFPTFYSIKLGYWILCWGLCSIWTWVLWIGKAKPKLPPTDQSCSSSPRRKCHYCHYYFFSCVRWTSLSNGTISPIHVMQEFGEKRSIFMYKQGFNLLPALLSDNAGFPSAQYLIHLEHLLHHAG